MITGTAQHICNICHCLQPPTVHGPQKELSHSIGLEMQIFRNIFILIIYSPYTDSGLKMFAPFLISCILWNRTSRDCFPWKLKQVPLSTCILSLHSAAVWISMCLYCITASYSSCNLADKRLLPRMVKVAEKPIGSVPTLHPGPVAVLQQEPLSTLLTWG